MSDPSESTRAELTVLLEERARYEKWLETLESRRDATPVHVYERVRLDYEGRQQRVTEQLGGRASELEGVAAALAERVAALYADEMTRRDERAEAELRAAVGEYDDHHTRDIVDRCDTEIAELSGQRATLGEELAKIQNILAQVTAAGVKTPATGSPAQVDDASPPEPAAIDGEPAHDVAPADADHASSPESIADAAAPTEVPAASAPERTAEPTAVEAAMTLEAREEPTDEAAGDAKGEEPVEVGAWSLPTIEEPPEVPPPPTPARILEDLDLDLVPSSILPAARRPATPPRAHVPPPRDPGAARPRSATLTPNGVPSFLRDVPSEQAKTLKCSECGTMNFPTEWYCERCGGELATL